MKTTVLASFALAVTVLFATSVRAQSAPPQPAKPTPSVETATLAAGCFWGTEEFFRKVPGVLETRVGYTGGQTKNPSYEDTSSGTTGHAESLELKFDPRKVSYEQLLTLFFKMHDPTTLIRLGNDRGTQYRSAIFFHGDQQKYLVKHPGGYDNHYLRNLSF